MSPESCSVTLPSLPDQSAVRDPSESLRGRVRFGVMVADLEAERLEGPRGPIILRPKVWRAFRAFLAHPDELLTQSRLLELVWDGSAVSPVVIANVVNELRRTLKRVDPDTTYIETIPRRGYRFIARPSPEDDATTPAVDADRVDPLPEFPHGLHGRGRELGWLASAAETTKTSATFQLRTVSGVAGVGKTSLLAALRGRLVGSSAPTWTVARAQCLAGLSASDAYAPVVRVLEEVAAAVSEEEFRETARQVAPWWLLQMLWLLDPAERDEIRKEVAGAGPQLPIREARRLLSTLARERPIALFLEDLHLADRQTLDLLCGLVQDPPAGPVLIVATFRSAEFALHMTSLEDLLRVCDRAAPVDQLEVAELSQSAIRDYVRTRYTDLGKAKALMPLVIERSGGMPLIMRATCDWIDSTNPDNLSDRTTNPDGGYDDSIPPLLARLLDEQVAIIEPRERALLEQAALLGEVVEAHEVAAMAEEDVEKCLPSLTRLGRAGHLIRQTGPHEFRFVHGTYVRYFASRVEPARARVSSRRLADFLAASDGGQDPHLAMRLARCSARADQDEAAITWASRAAERFLLQVDLASALSATEFILERLPPSEEISAQNATLANWQLVRANLIYWSSEACDDRAIAAFEETFATASRGGEDLAELAFRARLGTAISSAGVSSFDQADRAVTWLLRVARSPESDLFAVSQTYAAGIRLQEGRIIAAVKHARSGVAALRHARPGIPSFDDLQCTSRAVLGMARIVHGEKGGWADVDEAIARAESLGNAASLGLCSRLAGEAGAATEDWKRMKQHGDRCLEIGTARGLAAFSRIGQLLTTWVSTRSDPSRAHEFYEILRAWQESGRHFTDGVYASAVAEALAAAGDFPLAERVLDDVTDRVHTGHVAVVWQARGFIIYLAHTGKVPRTSIGAGHPTPRECFELSLEAAMSGADIARSNIVRGRAKALGIPLSTAA